MYTILFPVPIAQQSEPIYGFASQGSWHKKTEQSRLLLVIAILQDRIADLNSMDNLKIKRFRFGGVATKPIEDLFLHFPCSSPDASTNIIHLYDYDYKLICKSSCRGQ